jgi:HJR/Mrr/RecB family endonuclease
MTTISAFNVGEIYTNDQLRFSLDVENLGGIRPALDSGRNIRHVAVLTASDQSGRLSRENPYQDRIEGDILTYTAQGREGDQELKGRNKRLIEQYTVPTPLFGFVNLGRQTYRFLGLLELLRHYQELQADRGGSVRRVWLFEFRIHSAPPVVPIAEARAITATLLAESRQNNPLATLDREVAIPPLSGRPVDLQPTIEIENVRLQLLQIPPLHFEHFIKDVMEKSGFVEVFVTRASGDGGVDLNAYVEEANSFFAGTHVQAQVKRWRHAVGSPDINSFRGALSTTAKGVFVTTSAFTRAAVAEARHSNKPSISLIDGPRLSAIVLSLNLVPR